MKFKITDECGKAFAVEKKDIAFPNPRRFKEEPALKSDSCRDAESKDFTEEEIKDLKKLLKKIDAILALVKDEDDDKDDKKKDKEEAKEEKKKDDEVEAEVEEKISMDEFAGDEDLLEIPDEDEGIEGSDDLEDEDGVRAHDSKKSYGAIETKASIDDSIDLDTEIAQAWAKRYGGN